MERFHLVRRVASNGRSSRPNWDHEKVCRVCRGINRGMELVGSSRCATADLLLRTLFLRQHYRSCDCDVHGVPLSYPCCGNAAVVSNLEFGLLLKPGRLRDPLWNNRLANLFRCRVCFAKNLVVGGARGFGPDNYYLDCSWFCLVENIASLVTTNDTFGHRKTRAGDQ